MCKHYATASRVIALLIVLFAAQLMLAGDLDAKSCIDWPNLMAKYELSLLPEKGKTVLITPFQNFTKRSEDDWLADGMRDYLADLMRSSKNLKVLAGPTARNRGDVSAPEWTISGRFQRVGKTKMRIFVSFKEGSDGKLLKQLEATFPYPDNRDFFVKLAEVAKDLMGDMKAKWSPGKLGHIVDATASTEAFESYSKGRQLLETYNPTTAKKAEPHFKNALKIDFRSPLGYQGLIALYTFLGFYEKQMGKPFGSYYQRAQAELVRMKKLAKPAAGVFAYVSKKTQKKKGLHVKLDNRFLESNEAFMVALHAAQIGNLEEAVKSLERCVELVPEDAVAWQHLARTYSRMGDVAKSGEAMRKARESNPCI